MRYHGETDDWPHIQLFGAFIHVSHGAERKFRLQPDLMHNLQTLFLGDTGRVLVHLPAGVKEADFGLQGGEPLTLRSITRENVPLSQMGKMIDEKRMN